MTEIDRKGFKLVENNLSSGADYSAVSTHHSVLFSLEGRTAIVTGALGLLGREHCLALAAAGANVVVLDLDDNGCGILAGEISDDFGVRALGVGTDITNSASLKATLEYTLVEFGRVDVLVNNAAINDKFEDPASAAEFSKFENYPLEAWEQSLKVNLTGTFLASQVFGSEMARMGSGSIINIASTYGIVAPDQSLYQRPDGSQPFYKSAAYSTTKGAILAFTRFLAAYWGENGVRVNALSPGGVENGQEDYFLENYSKRTMLGRMSQTTDYHGALLFLASDASSYMTGANLVVDGGWTAW